MIDAIKRLFRGIVPLVRLPVLIYEDELITEETNNYYVTRPRTLQIGHIIYWGRSAICYHCLATMNSRHVCRKCGKVCCCNCFARYHRDILVCDDIMKYKNTRWQEMINEGRIDPLGWRRKSKIAVPDDWMLEKLSRGEVKVKYNPW